VDEVVKNICHDTPSADPAGLREQIRQIVELLAVSHEMYLRHHSVSQPLTPARLHKRAFA
jgi:hypothetical protein